MRLSNQRLRSTKLSVHSFKSIGASGATLPQILPINVIVGKNNSGKSALIDALQWLCMQPGEIRRSNWHNNTPPTATVTTELNESELRRTFPESSSRGGFSDFRNFWEYGQTLIGRQLTYSFPFSNFNDISLNIDSQDPVIIDLNRRQDGPSLIRQMASSIGNPIASSYFSRLRAERNIAPEANGIALTLAEDGTGLTNIIQAMLNRASLDRSVIEGPYLSALNSVLNPDVSVKALLARSSDDGARWEIYLNEDKKGLIPLSDSGSGLKSALLVAAHLELHRHLTGDENRRNTNRVLALEELENNLHPALLRRLISYIARRVVEDDILLFITTHSSVVIDYFATDPNAQIVHIRHDTLSARADPVSHFGDLRSILMDLDVRASDLFQANCVIWVEGPTDRYYLNRWIELATSGEIREGAHYQCLHYGGRLLSQLSASPPGATGDLTSLLRINGNAILVMDSDKRQDGDQLSESKRRLMDEVERSGGFVWVTMGREIENYLPAGCVGRALGRQSLREIGQFEGMSEYLNSEVSTLASTQYNRDKVAFAKNVVGELRVDELDQRLDWRSKMDQLIVQIRKWNGVAAIASTDRGGTA